MTDEWPMLSLREAGVKLIDCDHLRWLVRGPEWWEQIGKFLNVGAVFDSLRCGDVPNFELRIPPIPEQRAIAHILPKLLSGELRVPHAERLVEEAGV